MTRRNRRRQRTFDDTFDLIMNCTMILMGLLVGTAMVGIIYAMFVVILAMPNTY